MSVKNYDMHVDYPGFQQADKSFPDENNFVPNRDWFPSFSTATPSVTIPTIRTESMCDRGIASWTVPNLTGTEFNGVITAVVDNDYDDIKAYPSSMAMPQDISKIIYTTENKKIKIKLYIGRDAIDDPGDPFYTTGDIDIIPLKTGVPFDVSASNNQCDGTIKLLWQWDGASPNSFNIYSSTSPNGPFTKLSDVTGARRNVILPATNFTKGTNYYFKITGTGGTCPGEGLQSEVFSGIAPKAPYAPITVAPELLKGTDTGVKLRWNEKLWKKSDYLNVSSKKYRITRKDLKKGIEKVIDLTLDNFSAMVTDQVDGTDGLNLEYIDKETTACDAYSYKIAAVDNCTSSAATPFLKNDNTSNVDITTIDIKSIFKGGNLNTSKGYYSNLVLLDWKTDINFDFDGNYKIYRRQSESTQIPELMITVDKNTRSWEDRSALAKTMYEYYVVFEADCGLGKTSSYDVKDLLNKTYKNTLNTEGLAAGIGFRLPAATVSGNISYSGGIAVPDVKVIAERDGGVTGTCLSFDGNTQFVKINADTTPVNYSTTGFSTAVWIKPTTISGTSVIAKQDNLFKIELVDGLVKATVGGTIVQSNTSLSAGNFSNIFVTCDASTAKLYINGIENASVARTVTTTLPISTNAIYLATNDGVTGAYSGLIDEFRVYNTAIDAAIVLRDYSRIVSSETAGLSGYWRFDESNGGYVYDFSRRNGIYNKIDGEITGATWSTAVPAKEQLGFGAFTDQSGNYIIENFLFNGTGENIKITPTLTLTGSVHEFSPTSRILFLGEGKNIENNIDFTDRSSFQVTGNVRFNFDDTLGTNSKTAGSPGVSIWIDGLQQVLINGQPVLTDNNGLFSVSVPIGKHFLEFRKDNHTFVSNRFPALDRGTYDFQDKLSGLEILDNTKLKLVGSVVGGLVEGNKILGFLADKGNLQAGKQLVNNVGQTYFTITSTDLKINRRVETDPVTGEFEIMLPPLEYGFSDVKYISNDGVMIYKTDITGVKLNTTEAYTGVNQTQKVLTNGDFVDKTINYSVAKPIIYRTSPLVKLEDESGADYLPNTIEINRAKTLVGAKDIGLYDEISKSQITIPTSSLKYPLFKQGDRYAAIIKAVERYSYVGQKPVANPAIDEVPVLDGEVTVSNGIAAQDGIKNGFYRDVNNDIVELEGSTHTFNLQTNGSVYYSFLPGNPDFTAQTDPEDTYTKSIGITIRTAGKTIYWPNTTDSSIRYKGYVMGGVKLPGTNFITTAPATVESVLRVPPGSGSSVTITKESGFTSETSQSVETRGDWDIGIGVGIELEQEVPLVGIKLAKTENKVIAKTYGEKTNSTENTTNSAITFAEDISITSEDAQGQGDYFISNSKNIEIGRSNNLKFVPVENCVGCLGKRITASNGKQYVFGTADVYYQNDQGSTYFLYSEAHIKTNIIPNLESLRNSLFTSNPQVYTTKITADNPLYGVNNDDPRLGDQSNGTDYTKDNDGDDTGASYTFERAKATVEKGLIQDKVRWYNSQIRAWEEILMENEIEKWTAINTDDPERKNISISSGIAYNNSSTVEKEDLRLISNELLAGAGIASEIKLLFGAGVLVGPVFEISGNGDSKSGYSATTGTRKSVTTAYSIQDNDLYNTFSVNVFKGRGNDTPIFEVAAGQTSCPFEPEKELTVTKKHTYYLKYWVDNIPAIKTKRLAAINKEYTALIDDVNTQINKLNCTTGNKGEDDLCTLQKQQLTAKLTDLQTNRTAEIDKFNSLIERKQQACNSLLELYNADATPLIGNRTVQIEKPGILVDGNDEATRLNVPSTSPASFELRLSNNTELKPIKNAISTYKLYVDPASNPDGLDVSINGQSLVKPVEFELPFGQSIIQTLTVKKGPRAYSYKDLVINFGSVCDDSINASIKLDIDYIPVCSESAITSPGNNWTVNSTNRNNLSLEIGGYDINYAGFKSVKIQYKHSNESETDWKLLEVYYRNEDERANAGNAEVQRNAPLLSSQTGNKFIYNWDVKLLPDDKYDLRIQSICNGDNADVVYTSPTVTGIIDRVVPSPFGTPQPSDGILSAGEDISLQLNETINAGILTPYNFDIRAVLNDGKLRHPASLYFNGADNSMEIPEGVQLNRRSFSTDFYIKRKKTGAETVISQGRKQGQAFVLGFNSNNQVIVDLGQAKITAKTAIINDDSWTHIAFSYDSSRNEGKIFVNGKPETILSSFVPNYETTDKIIIGKDILGGNSSFNGNMHELRFWSKALSESEVNIVATKRLQDNEPGLIGNWIMEELEGKVAKDHIRLRNADIISGTWQASVTGNALKCDATSVRAITSPAYDKESDLTIEFWFNGRDTSKATLLSNGKGDNTDTNTTAWAIKSNNGIFEVWNNNNKFVATTKNYLDNQWHHFALVVNRRGNVTSYIDGKQEQIGVTNDIGFSGFGGSRLNLGSLGSTNLNGTNVNEEYFTGSLDEIRIWGTARKADQIDRDRRYMLKGDEIGLDLYLPFDTYRETAGINLLEPSIVSAATGDTAVKESGIPSSIRGTVEYDKNTPLIKIPRPISKVDFTYNVNGDKIILSPVYDNRIEKVTLDITVKNIQDLNGNPMVSPVTWTAYIDRNQVKWTEPTKEFNLETGKGITFETSIVNTGGKTYNFNINNLPSWLTANPSSGSIGPNSSLKVAFTVDENVNIGNYKNDIQLLTEYGYAEIMNLTLNVKKALPQDWVVNPKDFQYNMTIIGLLSINNIISRDPNDQVAAFVNGQCRGISPLKYITSADNYQAFLPIYSNVTSGENIELRVWKASEGEVYVDVTPTYQFVSNAVKGTSITPEILKVFNTIERSYSLKKGWNWISENLNYNYNPDKVLTTNDLLKSIKAVSGDLIRTIDLVDGYDSKSGWIGTISSNGGVKAGVGYKIYTASDNTWTYRGTRIQSAQTPINYVKGWNWIGLIGEVKIPVNQAFGNVKNLKTGDVIKSQQAISIYNDQFGWVGNLTHLAPGEGYMFKTEGTGSFNFPNSDYSLTSKGARVKETPENGINNIVASSKYLNTMNIIANVYSDDQSRSNVLRAYVGDELRSETKPVYNPILHTNTYFATIYGQTKGEQVTFKFEDSSEKVYPILEKFSFDTDMVIGKTDSPELLTIANPSTIENSNINIYHDKFNNAFVANLPVKHGILNIKLFDLQGKLVKSQLVDIDISKSEVNVSDLSKGVYLFVIYDESNTIIKSEKIIN